MNKIIASLILGMGLTGGVLVISVPLLLNNPIGDVLKIVIAGFTIAFVILAISAIVLRRRLDEQTKRII